MAQMQCGDVSKLKEILGSCHANKSAEELTCMLQKGVMVDNRIYTLDNRAHINVEVLARALEITWGNDSRYWKWRKESCNSNIEVAELIQVCWLDVAGTQDVRKLSPFTEYEVLFNLKLNCSATGFCNPVTFSFTTPDGCKKECQVNLSPYIGKPDYTHISVGKFTTKPDNCGCKHDLQFRMSEHGEEWKRGLVMKSVTIRAVNKC